MKDSTLALLARFLEGDPEGPRLRRCLADPSVVPGPRPPRAVPDPEDLRRLGAAWWARELAGWPSPLRDAFLGALGPADRALLEATLREGLRERHPVVARPSARERLGSPALRTAARSLAATGELVLILARDGTIGGEEAPGLAAVARRVTALVLGDPGEGGT